MAFRGTVLPALLAGLLMAVLAFKASADFDTGLQAYQNGDYKTALREWQPAADKGDPYAQHMLGFLYASGRGVPLDSTRTVQLWEQAADQGFAPAQYTLGSLFREGLGVKQNLAKAAHWISRAADAGYPDAQYDYGVMHATGEGVEPDLSTAYMWLDLAADTKGLESSAFWNNIDKLLTPAQRLEADRLKKSWGQ